MKHFEDPTQSNGEHSDDPTQSDDKHFKLKDPPQSNKEHYDDPTRNRISALHNFPLRDIISVTNNFARENFIGEGFLGKIYGGKLVSVSGELIDVAVRRLDNSFRLQELGFEKEISILSRLKHKNIVSIVGFCYENNEMLIINKRVARGSLRRHLSDPRLTWMIRLKISIGVVSALSYLHNYGIIHHNINSNTILLDENWEPKISGFEYSITIGGNKLDLAYEKLGIGTYKSDVYSLGVVLFELLCKKEAFSTSEADDNVSFQASLAIFHYNNRDLHKFVDPDVYSQMDQLSFNIVSKIAYDCLINHRAPPTMNKVLERLEKALNVQHKYENNDHSMVAVERRLPPAHLKLKLKSLEHMRIPLANIVSATKNFSKGCIVSSGGYGSVYTAGLEHVDKEYCFAIESDEHQAEVPKKHSIVAIKCIMDTEDEIAEQGFYAEIEMLTSCNHSNIITLLGFCDEGGKLILIYEYASNKSLSDYLQITSKNHNDSWAQRVKICLNVAKGLSYLHSKEGDKLEIVHRDIKSANILLVENFEAKIGDFGFSVFLPSSKDTGYLRTVAGTPGYVDPQYCMDAKLKKESDIYSFGVVLFEVIFGTVAYHTKYNKMGLALVARDHFNNGTIKEMVDPKLKEEITKTLLTSIKGPDQESMDVFIKIAYKCLAEEQIERPTMEFVVEQLENALLFQKNRKDVFIIPVEDVRLATDNFHPRRRTNHVAYREAFKGEVLHANGTSNTIIVGTWRVYGDSNNEFEILSKYKHDNIINLLGYCEEREKRILVYEYLSNGSLHGCMNDVSLTWGKRLKICIDIASGLDYLHGGSTTGEVVIHGDIISSNILLDANMKAKIADFSRSVVCSKDQELVLPSTNLGSASYKDPEYVRTGMLSKEIDIYSFGIVLFEVMIKKSGYEVLSLGAFVQGVYKQGKLDEMVFDGTDEDIAPQSLTIFRRIAIQCLHENREERPTARELVIQLNKALEIQEKGMDIVRISLEDIKYATYSFSDEKCIGRGTFGKVFKGQLTHANEQKIIAAKRLNAMHSEGDHEFFLELEILRKFTHKNVIGLEGFCDEMGEKIIVYEYAPNASLDNLLNDASLTWKKRLEICNDVASGLDFLHGGVIYRQETVLHRDIKSSNILLTMDWKAKLTGFERSLISLNNQDSDYVIEEDHVGTEGYIDPTYLKTHTISKATDMYSFGVVLFEILCGRLAITTDVNVQDKEQYLGSLAKKYYEQNKLDELVFEGIKEQIVPLALSTFAKVAYNCLHDDRSKRPTASEVVAQLKKALEFQGI